ncbi:hypothetical protein QBC37DRAFT_115826 [Rhypophila decipiens]|uniref:DUF6590 domain-containing protein n=1 Tax=Rhypophila decipiens TaxID=261697 RepID=A0AAN6YDI4_9PEZI|nr:hypothetical protein QBC37DRAFT_115826 [Rhypophila decipiens]
MTTTDVIPIREIGGKAHDTLFEDEGSGPDMNSKTDASSGVPENEVRESSSEKQHEEVEEGGTAKKHSRGVSGPQIHPPPKKEYGYQWKWDAEAKDYTHKIDGITFHYREYQRNGGITPSRNQTLPSNADFSQAKPEDGEGDSSQKATADLQADPASSATLATEKDGEEKYVMVSRNPEAESVSSSRQNSISQPLKEYQQPLDDSFTIVDKPKRFFQVGRIFAVVWFEPGGDNPPGRKADLEWTTECPKYHGEKPIAKYRWFVVVRKRLHHSLCFNITTIGPKGPRKADRGRGQDFVVLHNSNVEPSKPFEVEGITRDPIAVIIEAGEESISPWARLDCGRVYTVEDHLRVMKIGRIHTASLPLLETYFKESVS